MGCVTSETQPQTDARMTDKLTVVRGLFHLASVIILTVWGFLDWAFPLPAIFVALGALVLSVVIWALFLSPRPVLRTDRFGQALIELLLLAAAVGALLSLGAHWAIAVAFGLAGTIVGYIVSSRTH